ncbi:MAG: F0F1 ATP synthase subunit B [Fibrobacteria bacterium]|nr:F0F1 ATP synthase subunit B [Fibrobacteria bacterium]
MAPDPGVMIWVWVVFTVLLVLLHKFAWKPILKAVAEREAKLSESLSKADEAAAKAAAIEADHDRILGEAKAQAQNILNEQRDFAAKFRAQAESEAKESAEKIVSQAQAQIEAASEQARSALRHEAAELSVKIAEKILRSELEGAKAEGFADRMLSETAKN